LKINTDKEGLVNSGGESTSLFDVGERQPFQFHKFNLNVLRFFKIENQKLMQGSYYGIGSLHQP
jgi:hypothetical protein